MIKMSQILRIGLIVLGLTACGYIDDSVKTPTDNTVISTLNIVVSSSTPKPLTTDESFTFKGWILFLFEVDGENDLYIINPYSREILSAHVSILEPGFPAWSPDYQRIAFFGASDSIYIIESDCFRAEVDCLDGIENYNIKGGDVLHHLAWLADGESILFVREHDYSQNYFSLDVLSLQDGSISVASEKGGSWPVPSPDGDKIIFNGAGNIGHLLVYSKSQGTISRFLSNAIELPNSSYADWSPGGDEVVFMTTFGEGFAAGISFDIFKADAFGNNVSKIISNGLHPSWSPDGDSVVFERDDGIYIMKLSDGVEKRIFDLPLQHAAPAPAWSP